VTTPHRPGAEPIGDLDPGAGDGAVAGDGTVREPAPRDRRRRAGTVLAVFAAAVLATGALVPALADRLLLVGPGGALDPTVTSLAALGVAATAGVVARALLRRPGPVRVWEGAVVWVGAVATALTAVLALTGGWWIARIVQALLDLAVAQAGWPLVVLVLAAVQVGAVVTRARQRQRGVAVMPFGRFWARVGCAAGALLLVGTVTGHAVRATGTDVVVARDPAGACTIVVRQSEDIFTGPVTLYSGSGSVVTRVTTIPDLVGYPLRDGRYAVGFTADGAHVQLADVTETRSALLPCG